MLMTDKIRYATEYVARYAKLFGKESAINDAANIYAESYDEYMAICDALSH